LHGYETYIDVTAMYPSSARDKNPYMPHSTSHRTVCQLGYSQNLKYQKMEAAFCALVADTGELSGST